VRSLPFALLLLAAAPAFAGVEVHAKIQPEVIGIDETAVFTIEVQGDSFSSLRFHPSFELDNLEVLGDSSKYEDMRFINGSFSRTLRVSWQVRPLGLGKARVRAIAVQLNDDVVRLPACEVQVQREPTRPAQRSYGPPDEEEDPFQQFFGRLPNPWRRESEQPEVFLRAEIEPQQPVVGQQVLYTLYLYTREDISSLSPSGVPTFRGFWVRDIPIPQQLPTEMVEIEGRRFGRVPLLRKALFAWRPGRFKVEPAAVDLTVQRFDRVFFFRPPAARPEPLRLKTPGQWIDVQPLPPAPPGFAGAVGQLNLTADLQPRQIHLGDAATLTVRLLGAGNLQGVPEPRLSAPPGVTLFPPQQEGKEDVTGTTVRGSRTWRYVVVPDRAGRYTLETPQVTYFDPESRRYQVAAVPDLALTALPRPVEAAAGDGTPHGIRAAALPARGLDHRRLKSLLPWLFVLPWGLVLIVTLAHRRSHLATGRAGSAGSAPAAREFEAGLRRAESEERPRQVAARIEEAWRGLLSEVWDVPAATPPSRWREALASRGVNLQGLDELERVIEDVQYLRFAPQLSTTDTLRAEVISRCRRVARRLQ
jgi:oxygen tolerance protein BatD